VEIIEKHKTVERRGVRIASAVVRFTGNNLRSAPVFADPTPPAPCAAPVYRQFDFWVGDWDVFEVGGSIQVAHARVDIVLDGCVLRKDYQASHGYKGQSFTIYEAPV
jgi:hypothetical protein